MKLSDVIEEYLMDLMTNESIIEIQRNDLAQQFKCVPSQINYVISTRFNPERGFYIESRRGGGGNITISRINKDRSEYILKVISQVGERLSQMTTDNYIKDLLEYGLIDTQQAKLIKVATSDRILVILDNNTRDIIRATLFKNMIINLDD